MKRSMPKALTGLISAIVLLALWEGGVRLFHVPVIVLPAPSAIFLNIWENAGKLGIHAWVTTYEILIGFTIGGLIGVGTALAMTEYPVVRAWVYPAVIASQSVPKIAIAPLLIIWFGVGLTPKILTISLLALFPVLINTISGLESTDRGHLDLLRSVDAGKRQAYWHIRLPTALPHLFAGLKLAITVSVIGAIVGEWVASTQGLGYLLLFYTQYMDMISTFAVLVVLVALGLVFFAVVAFAEQALSWESRTRRQTRVVVAEGSL